jgi:hypothetical protein
MAQSMATTCHVDSGLKLMKSTGLNPMTSGARGRDLGRASQPMHPPMVLNIYMLNNLFEFQLI